MQQRRDFNQHGYSEYTPKQVDDYYSDTGSDDSYGEKKIKKKSGDETRHIRGHTNYRGQHMEGRVLNDYENKVSKYEKDV